jgi:hypothetical protein
MIPVGYMAKHVSPRTDWLKAARVEDVYSVSGCISKNFAEYISFWKHNGYWFFDSPQIIQKLERDNAINLNGTSLFYYEAFEQQFDGKSWHDFAPESSLDTLVAVPHQKQLEGFDIVTFYCGNASECSPLSCNSLAAEIDVNKHCLLKTFEEARELLERGAFENSEPGPYRIFAVYSVQWP